MVKQAASISKSSVDIEAVYDIIKKKEKEK